MVSSRSSDSPSSTPSSPKAVDFAGVTGFSRAANYEEHWAFYFFEGHAADCSFCAEPYKRYQAGKRLCREGNKLAHDIDRYAFRKDGEVYSRVREDGQKVRIEMPAGYDRTRSLLKAIERGSRSKHSFLSAEKPKEQPKSPSTRERAPVSPRGHGSPKLERATTLPTSARGNQSPVMERVSPISSSLPYTAIPIRQPVQAPHPQQYIEPESWHYPAPVPRPHREQPQDNAWKRGSLYDWDMARMAERDKRENLMAYKLEVREPTWPQRHSSLRGRPKSHRHSGFFF